MHGASETTAGTIAPSTQAPTPNVPSAAAAEPTRGYSVAQTEASLHTDAEPPDPTTKHMGRPATGHVIKPAERQP